MTRRSMIVLIAAMVLTACTGSSEPEEGSAAASTGPTEDTSTPTPTPSPTATPASPFQIGGGVVATIPVADAPMDTTVGFGSVWVSSHHADSVARIDPETNEVVAEIPSGVQPGAMLVTDDSVWVANYGDASLTRIDPSRNSSTVVPAGDGLTCGHPVEASGLVWVGECDAGQVVGIDPATNEVARTLDLKGFAFGANDQLWLASGFGAKGEGSGDDASLSRVDPRTGELLLTIDVGCGQTAENTSFDGDELWIAYRVGEGCSEGRLGVVDTTTGEVETVTKLGQFPGSPVVDGSQVWVNNTFDDVATVVDARTRLVTDTVEIPNLDELAVGFGAVWMADFNLSNVYRVERELG